MTEQEAVEEALKAADWFCGVDVRAGKPLPCPDMGPKQTSGVLAAEVRRLRSSRSTVEAELKAMTAERDEAAQGHEDQVHSLNRQIARIMAERDSALAEVKRLREAAHAFLAWIHPESMEPGHGAWPLVRQFRAALSPLPPAPSQNKEARP